MGTIEETEKLKNLFRKFEELSQRIALLETQEPPQEPHNNDDGTFQPLSVGRNEARIIRRK